MTSNASFMSNMSQLTLKKLAQISVGEWLEQKLLQKGGGEL